MDEPNHLRVLNLINDLLSKAVGTCIYAVHNAQCDTKETGGAWMNKHMTEIDLRGSW